MLFGEFLEEEKKVHDSAREMKAFSVGEPLRAKATFTSPREVIFRSLFPHPSKDRSVILLPL